MTRPAAPTACRLLDDRHVRRPRHPPGRRRVAGPEHGVKHHRGAKDSVAVELSDGLPVTAAWPVRRSTSSASTGFGVGLGACDQRAAAEASTAKTCRASLDRMTGVAVHHRVADVRGPRPTPACDERRRVGGAVAPLSSRLGGRRPSRRPSSALTDGTASSGATSRIGRHIFEFDGKSRSTCRDDAGGLRRDPARALWDGEGAAGLRHRLQARVCPRLTYVGPLLDARRPPLVGV